MRRLHSGEWDNEISFWRKEFDDLPDTLPILNVSPNSSRLRESLTTYRHLKSETRFKIEIASKIRFLCRKLKVTPFHFYCAIFQITLARLRFYSAPRVIWSQRPVDFFSLIDAFFSSFETGIVLSLVDEDSLTSVLSRCASGS